MIKESVLMLITLIGIVTIYLTFKAIQLSGKGDLKYIYYWVPGAIGIYGVGYLFVWYIFI